MIVKPIRSSFIEGKEYNFSPYSPEIGEQTEEDNRIWTVANRYFKDDREYFELIRPGIKRVVSFGIGEFCYLEAVIK
jgi:hypothetical protein